MKRLTKDQKRAKAKKRKTQREAPAKPADAAEPKSDDSTAQSRLAKMRVSSLYMPDASDDELAKFSGKGGRRSK